MNKKFWGIIIVIAALAIIAGIIYIIFFYKFSEPPPTASETSQPPPQKVEPATTTEIEAPLKPAASQPPLKKAEVAADDLARLASAFAERYGSFSNQSDYGNVRDLEIFMTDKLKQWAENYINDARARKTLTEIYYGIVTKAISSEIKQFDADIGQAEILVRTQRRELAGAAGNSSTFYQDISVKYSRERGVWRVDEIYWQNR